MKFIHSFFDILGKRDYHYLVSLMQLLNGNNQKTVFLSILPLIVLVIVLFELYYTFINSLLQYILKCNIHSIFQTWHKLTRNVIWKMLQLTNKADIPQKHPIHKNNQKSLLDSFNLFRNIQELMFELRKHH